MFFDKTDLYKRSYISVIKKYVRIVKQGLKQEEKNAFCINWEKECR